MTSKKIKLITNNNIHYIGLLFIVPNNISQKPNKNLIQMLNTNIFIDHYNQYPTIHIDYSPDFKFKKYIRDYIKSIYNVKNKYIIEIKLINTFQKLHNYMIIMKTVKGVETGRSITSVSLNENKFAWKPILNFYKIDNEQKLQNIYRIIYSELTTKSGSDIFKSNLVYKHQHFNYLKIIQLLCNLDEK